MLFDHLFYFYILFNWPSSIRFLWDSSTVVSRLPIDVEWSSNTHQNNLILIQNTEEFEKAYGLAFVSVCSYLRKTQDFTYEWELMQENSDSKIIRKSKMCSTEFQLKHQIAYSVTVKVLNANSTVILTGKQMFEFKPIWVTVIGDSFSSGDGNPMISGIQGRGKWLNDSCHRSTASFAYESIAWMAEQNPTQPVYLTFTSCAGSTIENGILTSRSGRSQMEELEEMKKIRGNGPDYTIMTVGGNDIGFSQIMHVLKNPSLPFPDMNMRFLHLTHNLERLASAVTLLGSKRVILPLYYDFSRNEFGEVDGSCEEFFKISSTRLAFADSHIFQRLNTILQKKAREFGWISIDSIPQLFEKFGMCSSHRLIRSSYESILLQGSPSGSFHPTKKGHQLVAEELKTVLKQNLLT